MLTVEDVPTMLADRIRLDPVTDCWVWTGRTNPDQFPMVKWRGGFSARRLVWSLIVGPLPSTWRIGNWCDTPRCVNPHHAAASLGYTAAVAARQVRCHRRAATAA